MSAFESTFSQYSYLRFSTTIDKFFTSEFLNFFLKSPFLIKSLNSFSELSAISLTISLDGEMLLTLSKSLDQASGLDASKPVVDSAIFDSSTRLLRFDLKEISKQKNRLERIQSNSKAALSKAEYSCEFLAVVESSTFISVAEEFKSFGIDVIIDQSLRPKIVSKALKKTSWPVKDEFDIRDNDEIMEHFEWIGQALLKPDKRIENLEDNHILLYDCLYLSIEGPLLPPILQSNLIPTTFSSSMRLLVSLKCCQKNPPPFELNLNRLKHFNDRKFDPSACSADQMALVLFKSPMQTLTFRINSTS